MMNYEQMIYSMTMAQLVEEAKKYSVKIDKKGSKTKAADKILAAYKATEAATIEEVETEEVKEVETVEAEVETEEVEAVEAVETEEVKTEEVKEVEPVEKAVKARKAPAKKTAEEFMSTIDIEYTVDKKGRYNFGKKAFYLIFKSNSITMAPTKAFREAHQEVEWDFHEGWSNPYRTPVTEDFVRAAIEEVKKNAEAAEEEVEEK